MYENLEKTLTKSISLIKKSVQLDIEDLHKPISGSEKSLFPIVMAAAWQSGFIVSPENKVTREDTQTAGAVDAIFFDSDIEQDFIVEAKIATSKTEISDLKRIDEKLSKAKTQLKNVKRARNGLSRRYGLVSCVIVKILHSGHSKEVALEKHVAMTKRRLQSIRNNYESKNNILIEDVCFKEIVKSHSQNSLTKAKSSPDTWCGGVVLILELVREPK